MTVIPMTHASGMGPLPDLLRDSAGTRSVARAFAAAGLPASVAERPDARVPLAAMVALFAEGARLSGDPMFGWRVGARMEPEEYGLWIDWALQAPTLGGALARMERGLALHQNGTRLCVAPRGPGLVAWEYRVPAPAGHDARAHGDHALPGMIRVVQRYLGPDWVPLRIELPDAPPGAHRAALEEACGAACRGGHPALALVMPAAALAAALPAGRDRARLLTGIDVEAAARARAVEPAAERIAAIVALRLLDGNSDIDGAAALAGLGRRALQRALDRDGWTYRGLLTEVRMRRAAALLGQTQTSVTDIAFDLGYTDPAHFARAFRRHAGLSPSGYRLSRAPRLPAGCAGAADAPRPIEAAG